MGARRFLTFAPVALLLLLEGCAIPRWPVEGPLTSPYGLRMRGWSPAIHRGVDIFVPEGTPVRAMKPGTVLHAGPRTGYGLAVYLDHGRGLVTVYGHLSSVDVTSGERVRHRQVIGRSGMTGNATGPHLHFEVRRNGRVQDPVPLLGGEP